MSLFANILNMSLTASLIILFVLLARLLLKRAPKVFSYALWAVMLFRLLCPVSMSSSFSLLNLWDVPMNQQGSMDDFVQANQEAEQYDLRPMLMIDGELYLDTGQESAVEPTAPADGQIQTTVGGQTKPTENQQSNFGCIGAAYWMGDDSVTVYMNEKWIVFEREE